MKMTPEEREVVGRFVAMARGMHAEGNYKYCGVEVMMASICIAAVNTDVKADVLMRGFEKGIEKGEVPGVEPHPCGRGIIETGSKN